MAELKYKFTRDTVFKMLFMERQDLLKKLIAVLLDIPLSSIDSFTAYIKEVPPKKIGAKSCRLDISMTVNGQIVDLEVQVKDEKDYPERVLFMGALDYVNSLKSGNAYKKAAKVIVISILAFPLFDCEEYRSEFMLLELTRHIPMTDRMSFQFYELPKLPENVSKYSDMEVWLALFNAKTEEDLAKLEALEVSFVQDAIGAYSHVIATDEFMRLERDREIAERDEASALYNARQEEREKWEKVVAEKDALIAELMAKK